MEPEEEDAPALFVTEGLLAGTRLASDSGWRDVRDLRPGDAVLSAADGFVEITAVSRALCSAGPRDWPEALWPLLIPPGALGNPAPLRLLPEQLVLAAPGGEEVALPAGALAGRGGIVAVAPDAQEEVIVIGLAAGAMICAEGSLRLYCPADSHGLPPGFAPDPVAGTFLSLRAARAQIARADAEAAPPEGDADAEEGAGQAALRAPSP